MDRETHNARHNIKATAICKGVLISCECWLICLMVFQKATLSHISQESLIKTMRWLQLRKLQTLYSCRAEMRRSFLLCGRIGHITTDLDPNHRKGVILTIGKVRIIVMLLGVSLLELLLFWLLVSSAVTICSKRMLMIGIVTIGNMTASAACCNSGVLMDLKRCFMLIDICIHSFSRIQFKLFYREWTCSIEPCTYVKSL